VTQADPQARDLTAYHQETIADPEAQFEELETTLSHLFSDPHPALEGRTYAHAIAHKAFLRDWIGPGRNRVVEVGGGTGRFAAGLAEALLTKIPDLRYTIVELSPALHAAQVQRLRPLGEHAESRLGHADSLELPDSSVDFLVSNEVIADLRIGFVTRGSLATGQADAESDAEALALVRKYGLETHKAPEPVPIQVGATRLIEQIAQALKLGGIALLTEFGAEKQFPIESTHLDHAEWSVHFGHLVQVAQSLGLEATLEPLPQLLGLRADVWVLASTRTQFRNLRYLLRSIGADLRKRALTPDQLALVCAGRLRADRIEGLQFRPVGERVMGLVPSEFQALILRRPS
jgi:SAM-dependent methyltransferase